MFLTNSTLPVHIPPLFHAVDLQIHVCVASLYPESEPLHPVQKVAFAHPLQLMGLPPLTAPVTIRPLPYSPLNFTYSYSLPTITAPKFILFLFAPYFYRT